MKKLIIIGASGFGKEVYWLASRCGREVLGFLDDTDEKQGKAFSGSTVLGKINDWINFKDCDFIIAIGSPSGRKKVSEKMKELGEPSFCILIDPSATVGQTVIVGEGSVICAGVICTVDIKLGSHVILNINTTVGHDVKIADYCTVAPSVSISGNIDVESLVEIGTGAKLREKITVGREAMIGMGAVVTKPVEAMKVVIGNPAKSLNRR